jgi:adenylate kinase family enzyme
MQILVLGAPGVGKTTLVKLLNASDRSDLRALDLDDISYHPDENHDVWTVDVDELSRIKDETAKAGVNFIAAGMGTNYYEWLDLDWDKIVALIAPSATIKARQLSQPEHGRPPMTPEEVEALNAAIKNRADTIVNADRDPNEIASAILELVHLDELVVEEEPHDVVE